MAAVTIGDIYNFGQGVAIDYERAVAGYKIGAEWRSTMSARWRGTRSAPRGGNALCQYNLGHMFREGRGIDSPDYKQALV